MNTVKQTIESILNRLPDNCSVEDIQYHLYVLEKVSQSLNYSYGEYSRPQKEVEGLLNKWLIE